MSLCLGLKANDNIVSIVNNTSYTITANDNAIEAGKIGKLRFPPGKYSRINISHGDFYYYFLYNKEYSCKENNENFISYSSEIIKNNTLFINGINEPIDGLPILFKREAGIEVYPVLYPGIAYWEVGTNVKLYFSESNGSIQLYNINQEEQTKTYIGKFNYEFNPITPLEISFSNFDVDIGIKLFINQREITTIKPEDKFSFPLAIDIEGQVAKPNISKLMQDCCQMR